MKLSFPPYTLTETRQGAGSPVALIHGLSGSTRWWGRNIDALAERHLVAAVDLVGFGSNRRFLGPPEVLPSFPEVTALLARWLETFGEPVHVVGHSMGGQIAIRLAAERPDLVRSLILVNAAGIPFQLHPLDHLKPLPKPPFGGPRIARVLIPDFLRAGPTSVAVASARVLLGDMRDAMHAIEVPTLLVWGENDPLVPLRYGEAMSREIANARLVVLPRAAHVAMWDAPEEFNRVALGFLDEVDRHHQREPHRGMFSWGICGFTDVDGKGIAHRQSGRNRDVVLIHGLGMSSAYFVRLAESLFTRGWSPIAPDLPGFGESADAPGAGPRDHARILAAWADSLGIRNAVWLGHSLGCNAVAHLARERPDLVRLGVYTGPLWSNHRHARLRLFAMLVLDALREPLALYRYVIRAYWRTGLWRWLRTWQKSADDVACRPDVPTPNLFVSGQRDPITDRRCTSAIEVPGAHACLFSDPDAVAGLLT
ncbi:MAG TPA: alpha/beta fold hydrolase [Thermoanaerobaculia bacterium]